MSRASVTLLLFSAAVLLHVCAAQERRVIDWLKNNKDTTTAAGLLQQLYPKPISDQARLTLRAGPNHSSSGWPLHPVGGGCFLTEPITCTSVTAAPFLRQLIRMEAFEQLQTQHGWPRKPTTGPASPREAHGHFPVIPGTQQTESQAPS